MKRILQGLRKKQAEAAKPDAVATAAPAKGAIARRVPEALDRVLPQKVSATHRMVSTKRPTRARTARGQVNRAIREEGSAIRKRSEPEAANEGSSDITITIKRGFQPTRKGAQ